MNNFSKQDANKNFLKIIMVLVLVLLSNVSVFGQAVEKNVVSNSSIEVAAVKKEAVSNESSVNFVLWFMGSKQDPNSTISKEGVNTKKQIMTSGLAPNKLLIKTFLKKAVNLESALA